MKSIHDLTAKDVMRAPVEEVSSLDTLSKVIAFMHEKQAADVVVYENGVYKGAFGFKQLLKTYNVDPTKVKVKDKIVRPARVDPDRAFLEVLKVMFDTGQKVVLVEDDGKIKGIITEPEVMEAIINSKEMQGRKVADVMSTYIFDVKTEDKLSDAVRLMQDGAVGRLPVTDKNEKVVGVIEAMDLIKTVAPRESMTSGEYVGEKTLTSNLPVKQFMTRDFPKAKAADSLVDMMKDAVKLNTSTIMVLNEYGQAEGIVAPKDIIEQAAGLIQREGVYVQVLGLDASRFETMEVEKMIEDSVKKLSKIVDLSTLTIHAKKRHTEGRRQNTSLRARMHTKDLGLIMVKDDGWDVIDTSSKLLKELERVAMKYKNKERDQKIELRRRTNQAA